MRKAITRKAMTVAAASALSAGAFLASAATPANAAPIAVGNLVNIQVSNVLNNNDVDVAAVVPIGVAANVCDVDVNVLTTDLADDGTATCTNRGGQAVTITQ